jgi:peptide/nickel transport system permease protein
MRRFFGYKVAALSLFVLIGIVLFAFLGEAVWIYSVEAPTANLSMPPSWAHPFGTDHLGYDLMAGVMRGTQRSLLIAAVVAVVATLVGSLWGAIAAYAGGWVDTMMMRFVDLLMMFPMIAVAAFLGQQAAGVRGGWYLLALVLAGLSWATLSRVVRSVVLSLRMREYIQAARIYGSSPARIIVRHLLPNSIGPIIVSTTLLIAWAILAETSLSYLGFGVQPPDTSLGLLINRAQSAITTRPWLFYFPGLFIIGIMMCISLIGDGLRAAMDPRQK